MSKLTVFEDKFIQKSLYLQAQLSHHPSELRIQQRVSVTWPKPMLENFLNKSKTTLKKSIKRLF